MKIFIVRHGETDLSRKGIIQGQIQSVLTMDGKLQAEAIATRMKGEKIERVVSSPLQRAMNTASIVGKQFRLELEVDEDLRERSFGIYEGNPLADIERILPGRIADPHFRPPKGEDMGDVFCRASAFMKRLAADGRPTLILGHKHINRMLLMALLGFSHDEGARIKQWPASLSIVDYTGGKGKALMMNDVTHLKNPAQEIEEVF